MAAAVATPKTETKLEYLSPDERSPMLAESIEAMVATRFAAVKGVSMTKSVSLHAVCCAVVVDTKVSDAVLVTLPEVDAFFDDIHKRHKSAAVTNVVFDLFANALSFTVNHSGRGASIRTAGAKRKQHADAPVPSGKKSNSKKSAMQVLTEEATSLNGYDTPIDAKCEVLNGADLCLTGYRRIPRDRLTEFLKKVSVFHSQAECVCSVDLATRRIYFRKAIVAAAKPAAAAAAGNVA